tara:strand:+ start:53 stop:586 length:534 start_codon:yes stop_codon:yes gene_type:complete
MEIDNLDIAAPIGSDELGETDTWNMSLYDQITSLEGRINRLRYLTLNILTLVGAIVYIIIIASLTFFLPEPIWSIVTFILLLPLAYISYALAVKRLQDTGRGDGWITYAQISVGLNIIYTLTQFLESEINSNNMEIISTLVALPLGIVCLFYRGDTGPNKFGPDPIPKSSQERGVQV